MRFLRPRALRTSVVRRGIPIAERRRVMRKKVILVYLVWFIEVGLV